MIDAPNPSIFKRQLKVMKRNAIRLLDLVNQLLDLSRIESGKLSLNLAQGDIMTIIRGITMSFHSMAEQKHIILETRLEPNQLGMSFDKEKLETILTNLLSNAFKFTPDHGKIGVFCHINPYTKHKKSHEYIEIIIKDNGNGIEEQELNHIFNRFYQSETNQLNQQDGSGIGLVLTKELVELHEGFITAKSTVGQGTEMIVEIPTNLKTNQPPLPLLQIEGGKKEVKTHENIDYMTEETTNIQTEQPLVLIIEDQEDVRHYIEDSLKNRFQIITANNGDQRL